MDELYAAIADHLRAAHNATKVERVRQLFEYRAGRYPAPRCLVCGCPVDDDGGLFNLADMQLRRQCEQHYCPF